MVSLSSKSPVPIDMRIWLQSFEDHLNRDLAKMDPVISFALVDILSREVQARRPATKQEWMETMDMTIINLDMVWKSLYYQKSEPDKNSLEWLLS